jgi:ribonuclease BN (tRNA processing enzyme)
MLITSASGKCLLVDCGSDIRFSLREIKSREEYSKLVIDAVYISHCHSDHVGGMEFLAITNYFSNRRGKLKLFAEEDLMLSLWNETLKGLINCIQGKSMHIDDYFICNPLKDGSSFVFDEIIFTLVRMPHVTCNERIKYSYGLLIGKVNSDKHTIFISTDSQFSPDIISLIAPKVDTIFHDCETTPFKTGVHAHYDELLTLPVAIRNKLWLYHYNPDPAYDPKAEGFKGFITKGQEFHFD